MHQRPGKVIAIYVMRLSFTPNNSISDAIVIRRRQQETTLQRNVKFVSMNSQTLLQSGERDISKANRVV